MSLKRKNSLPGICGRVCPQEVQCESRCVLAKKGAPVAIGRLERYVADWEQVTKKCPACELLPPSGKRAAVVGSGPAGPHLRRGSGQNGPQGHHLRGPA